MIQRRTRVHAFTLIELLVVIGIISLLVSIMLPAMGQAREAARSSKCAAQMRMLAVGLNAYTVEYHDWLPGANTSGVATKAAIFGMQPDKLSDPTVPVQHYDWATPILAMDRRLPTDRARRMTAFTEEFSCPSMISTRSIIYPSSLSGSADRANFEKIDRWTGISYLMPVHFQLWGLNYDRQSNGKANGRPIPITTCRSDWEGWHQSYQSMMNMIGNPSSKVFIADGTRYLPASGLLDHDVKPMPSDFGSYCSSGAWWSGSTAYGADPDGVNWDNQPLTDGSPSKGRNLALSYRHASRGIGRMTQHLQDNEGNMNAAFYDGHVERLSDKDSRNVNLWYPKGTQIVKNEGMTTPAPDISSTKPYVVR